MSNIFASGKILFSLLYLICLSISAQSGQYKAGMTSGLIATSTPGVVPNPSYGFGSCSLPGAGGGNGAGEIKGTLTTTFTWEPAYPNEPPPVNVIVIETCYVDMKAQALPGTVSASASNGLDVRFCTNTTASGPVYTPIPVPPFQFAIGTGQGSVSNGVAAKVKGGGVSVVVTNSPTGKCTTSNGPFQFAFSYSVKIYPIQITTSGTILANYIEEILPGQKIAASLSSAPDTTFENHSWIVPGITFDSFVITPSQDQGTMISVNTTEWSKPSPSWRWMTNTSADIFSTATAKYKGLGIGGVSALKKVFVRKILGSCEVSTSSPGQMILGGTAHTLTSKPATFGNAATILYSAVTPETFTLTQGPGQVGLHQLIDFSKTGTGSFSVTGALDNVFLYTNWKVTSASVQNTYVSVDSPFVKVSSLDNIVSVNFIARDYAMFLPPSNGYPPMPVPIKGASWKWEASAERDVQNEWIYNSFSTEIASDFSVILYPEWITKYVNIN
jgi:hypothetical protein